TAASFGGTYVPNMPAVLVKKDDVVSSLPSLPGSANYVVGTVVGTHCAAASCDPPGLAEPSGYFNSFKRNVMFNQSLGNTLDQLPPRVLFDTSTSCTVVTP